MESETTPKGAQEITLLELAKLVALSAIVALAITTFIGFASVVEGSSMEPTLHSGDRLIVDALTYRFREPRRGEVIVFRNPSTGERYIKRVVGLPGDVVVIRDGAVYVNGRRLVEDYVQGPTIAARSVFVVPKKCVFVLGDNRPGSADSRSEVGFLPLDKVLGRALIRFWPLSQLDVIEVPDLGV